ncbi:hypothetical protein SteCoe_5739 [Stentor coeruleus]|uniref:Uncharacterized protein n=1 Tax=Stentor coeruleus TaxID=5963 RepID=A0A1R2CRU3_9CILI|nr:hypothetical protein SteCoe_5739 [Stentor coeruleus]
MGCGVSQKFEPKGELNKNLQNKPLSNNKHLENTKSQNTQSSKPITISKDVSAISTPSINQPPTETKPSIPTFKTSSDKQNQNPINLKANNSLTEKPISTNQNHSDSPSLTKPHIPLSSQTLHQGFESHPHEFDFSFLEENHTAKVEDLETEKILKELLEN